MNKCGLFRNIKLIQAFWNSTTVKWNSILPDSIIINTVIFHSVVDSLWHVCYGFVLCFLLLTISSMSFSISRKNITSDNKHRFESKWSTSWFLIWTGYQCYSQKDWALQLCTLTLNIIITLKIASWSYWQVCVV